MRRFTTLAVLVSLGAAPAFADTITGRVIAYDRVSHVLVLKDKTVWTLDNPELSVPDNLAAGSTVTIEYESAGEDGFVKADFITVIEG